MPAGAGTAAPADPYARLAGIYDEVVVDPCYPQWAQFCVDLWQFDSRPVRNVLDVCCGTGRMMAEFARHGCRTVGVDASSAMLIRARDLLGDSAELHQAWLPQLATSDMFDAAVSTFDGLNYVPSGVFAQSLAAVAKRLRPGGWFVFDLHTEAMMRFTAAIPVVHGRTGDWSYTVTFAVDVSRRECRTVIDAAGPAGAGFTETHQQYFHTDSEVRRALAEAGFSRVAGYDDYALTPASPDTLRATWVARL